MQLCRTATSCLPLRAIGQPLPPATLYTPDIIKDDKPPFDLGYFTFESNNFGLVEHRRTPPPNITGKFIPAVAQGKCLTRKGHQAFSNLPDLAIDLSQLPPCLEEGRKLRQRGARRQATPSPGRGLKSCVRAGGHNVLRFVDHLPELVGDCSQRMDFAPSSISIPEEALYEPELGLHQFKLVLVFENNTAPFAKEAEQSFQDGADYGVDHFASCSEGGTGKDLLLQFLNKS
ncbi:hypothetical protein Taro_038409 [Colocasia esculenta]|uniref:Uncharacterized protein n=1 Tax=Colocasia esculenta TaxID=4460 RepID=A0A843WDT9_COLES|nr:hypothetical protein [Colocasia esculenta]